MKTRYLIAVIAALSVSASAFAAADGEALFKSKNCNVCHKLDSKTVGPALKAISAKYVTDKEAPARLAAKVRAGGVGVWGSIAMPKAASSVSDEEIKTIVEWILARK